MNMNNLPEFTRNLYKNTSYESNSSLDSLNTSSQNIFISGITYEIINMNTDSTINLDTSVTNNNNNGDRNITNNYNNYSNSNNNKTFFQLREDRFLKKLKQRDNQHIMKYSP